MDENKKFNLNLIRLVLMALFLRFLIMPFSFHGSDIFWINYFPFKFIEGKIFDPYLFINENMLDFKGAYYPPGTFFITSFFQLLFKPFLPKLNEFYSIFTSWHFTWDGNTIHFADILIRHQLFRTLFLFKMPYLICDFIIGIVLYQLLKKDKKKVFIALIVWALNPFVLQSIYALGQLDIIVAMFIILSLFAVKLERPYLAVICLSFGAGIKATPLLLIPAALIILGKTLREKIKLGFISLMIFLVPFIPFFISSEFAVFKIVGYYNSRILPWKRDIFIMAYFGLLFILYFLKKKNIDSFRILMISFISILLLFYVSYEVTLRFFVWITPLLIIVAVQDRIFWLYNILFFVTLFELRAAGNSQQWGLFAALHPEFFSGLPIADSYLNLLVNVKHIHHYMYILFNITALTMIIHMVKFNFNLFKFHFPVLGRDEKS